jgi:hypothetical protein
MDDKDQTEWRSILGSMAILCFVADVERIPTQAPRWQGAFFKTQVENDRVDHNTPSDSLVAKDEGERWRKQVCFS